MSVSWLEYEGKKILQVDYRGLEGKQLIENLESAYKLIMETPGPVVTLNRFEGVYLDRAFMARAKALSKPKGERKMVKAAGLGIDGMKMILLRGYNTFTGAGLRPFASEAEALKWLTE